MNEDLEAINVLSDRFKNDFYEAKSSFSGPDHLRQSYLYQEFIPRGEQISRMYQAELQKYPENEAIKVSYAGHLFRMGGIGYILSDPDAAVRGGSLDIKLAQDACAYFCQSYAVWPAPMSAGTIADLFRDVGFYGTATYWYQQAETAARKDGKTEAATENRAKYLELRAQGKVADPPLTPKIRFPTPDTAGLLAGSQSNMNGESSGTSIQSPISSTSTGANQYHPSSYQGTLSATQSGSSQAVTVLILGILSLFFCSVFTGIPAWIMGSSELRAINEGRLPPSGKVMALIGMVLGIISTVLAVGFIFSALSHRH